MGHGITPFRLQPHRPGLKFSLYIAIILDFYNRINIDIIGSSIRKVSYVTEESESQNGLFHRLFLLNLIITVTPILMVKKRQEGHYDTMTFLPFLHFITHPSQVIQ